MDIPRISKLYNRPRSFYNRPRSLPDGQNIKGTPVEP
jgi:hypothetical protein